MSKKKSALDDFANLLGTTDVVRQVLKSLKEEPAYLLRDICREYLRTGEPVPDHRLRLAGYMAAVTLKALLSSGLIRQLPGGRLSIYTYEPTTEGLDQCDRLTGPMASIKDRMSCTFDTYKINSGT
jgi:hypothetical protein